ncbi:TrkH family potassium uptake protein [Micavibrio aeruginosavorus]|uniref:Potassium uptake protein TrkH n=1 Tax=Micavibrio aeruginosavorus EPB TaxID=349215 RepID=M4VGX2_9BACT|nr:TrkH family potassium uptake protein [Micavibrio aeruginosavorus]AGH97735.1 Potassium uptake protein TrkH [Micavibrio aeruginosavorus EPB]
MDLRPIFYVVGALLCILAISMSVPMFVDMVHNHADWKVFLLCMAITAFFGGTTVLTNASDKPFQLTIKQTFLLTAISWFALAAFGALPFWLASETDIDFTDAFFEAVSGITTTGATVLTGLDSMPPGILMWRCMLNALGGIGFIVAAMAVLPFLRVGGMQLYRTESSDKSDKVLPRMQKVATAIAYIYFGLIALCALCYWMAGMSGFDAITHAMSSVATGGFANYDSSFGAFLERPHILWISMIFMILGGLPFVLYIKVLGGNFNALISNTQVRTFLALLGGSILVSTIWLSMKGVLPFGEALLQSAFNIVSVVTTTGYASADYMQWGPFFVVFFFILTFFGGCTGSTSGGVKIMRYQVMALILGRHFQKLQQPNAIIALHYDGRTLPDDVPYSVMVFIFGFLGTFIALALALSMCGLDFITSLSGAATALTNVGPGLGPIIGPAGNFSTLPDAAKWLISAGMMLGRLELFTLLVLVMPSFWRK